MRHRNELDLERSEIDAAARSHDGDRDFRRIALGGAFGLEQRGTELCRVDRAFQLRPQVDDGAEMVFVGMGQHQSDQVVALFFEERDVGHDQIDAGQMLLIAEGHAEIDREPGALLAVAQAIDRQVHADLADAAERRKGQFIRPRHQAAPTEAAEPKYTSPAAIGMRLPSCVRTIRHPVSSMVSKVPSIVWPPVWIATRSPSPAARASHRARISAKPRPLSQMPRNSTQASDSAENSSSAPIWTPSAASEVAGVGVPSGAAMTLVPIPTTTASRLPATASASSRMPASFCRPASTSFGHFSENFIWSDPADLSDASMLTFCSAASSATPAAKPSVAATAGETSITSRMLLARLPRGAIQGRCLRPRPAVCSDVTNHIGPRSPSRARAMASALVEPI